MGQEDKVVQWFSELNWIQVGARIAAILAVSFVLGFVARRLISGLEKFTATHAHDIEARRRAATVSNVLRKLATILISAIAILAIFNTLGISILPFLATAGVAGIAIAFGAQSLVKDFFRGFFLLAENQIRQGDVVEIAGKSGLVEDLTLRYVQLRDYEGNVHYVPKRPCWKSCAKPPDSFVRTRTSRTGSWKISRSPAWTHGTNVESRCGRASRFVRWNNPACAANTSCASSTPSIRLASSSRGRQ
ncbi:MAG: mscS [Steroidobacteraceae bacterium]|nr:mscS [Steroidobacteraceae bacterium]